MALGLGEKSDNQDRQDLLDNKDQEERLVRQVHRAKGEKRASRALQAYLDNQVLVEKTASPALKAQGERLDCKVPWVSRAAKVAEVKQEHRGQ